MRKMPKFRFIVVLLFDKKIPSSTLKIYRSKFKPTQKPLRGALAGFSALLAIGLLDLILFCNGLGIS